MSSTAAPGPETPADDTSAQDQGQPETEAAPQAPVKPAAKAEAEWERKRRIAEIFGDVLPSTTRDERDPGRAGGQRRSASDEWLLSQVPPHHGGHG